MLDKFRNLKGSTKALVIGAGVALLLCIGLIVAVIATGGFNGI